MAISFKPAALALDMGTIKVNTKLLAPQHPCDHILVADLALPAFVTLLALLLPCVVAQPYSPSPGPCPSASRPCWAPQPLAWEQTCSVRQARTAKEVSMKDNHAPAAPLSGALTLAHMHAPPPSVASLHCTCYSLGNRGITHILNVSRGEPCLYYDVS